MSAGRTATTAGCPAAAVATHTVAPHQPRNRTGRCRGSQTRKHLQRTRPEACVHLRTLHRQQLRPLAPDGEGGKRRRWRREGASEGGAHDAVAGEGGAEESGTGEGGADERGAGEGGADERGAGERGAGVGDDGLEHDDDHCTHAATACHQ